MREVDVVVVGAGPAGSAAAMTLARAGREVLVIDRARFPRDKCCGDGLTTGALRELDELGLSPSSIASWQNVDACWVRSPSGRTVAYGFSAGPGIFAAVARRSELDETLVQLARDAGAQVAEGCALREATAGPDAVTLTAEGVGPIRARYVIGADGMWSPLRKALQGGGSGGSGAAETAYLGEWHAFRQYLRVESPLARRMWVWFEPSLLPGYAWSFPLADGIANVGFGIRRRAGHATRSMAHEWRELLALPHIRDVIGPDVDPEAPHKAWPIPARMRRSTLSAAGGRALFVGDAARATDPMTGEGIAQALETGRRAARAVVASGPHSPALAASQYASGVRAMVTDQRLAAALSGVLRTQSGARGAVRISGATPWTRRNFARWLFEDYPRAALVTPSRWRPRLWHGPGAFVNGDAGGAPTAAPTTVVPHG